MISHIVLFEPKPQLTEAETLAFAQQIQATMRAAGTVVRAYVGRRIAVDSGQARSFGDSPYVYSAVIDFKDRDGLIQYLNHPAHHELGRLFWLHCARTVVIEVECLDAKSSDVVDLLVGKQN